MKNQWQGERPSKICAFGDLSISLADLFRQNCLFVDNLLYFQTYFFLFSSISLSIGGWFSTCSFYGDFQKAPNKACINEFILGCFGGQGGIGGNGGKACFFYTTTGGFYFFTTGTQGFFKGYLFGAVYYTFLVIISYLILQGSADFKRLTVAFGGDLFTEEAYLILCYFGSSLLSIVLPMISFAKNAFLSQFLKFSLTTSPILDFFFQSFATTILFFRQLATSSFDLFQPVQLFQTCIQRQTSSYIFVICTLTFMINQSSVLARQKKILSERFCVFNNISSSSIFVYSFNWSIIVNIPFIFACCSERIKGL